MFLKASKLKLRFDTNKGILSAEDLWDLSLDDLDDLARGLNKEVKDSTEESFITIKTKKNAILDLKFEIVKEIIKVRLEEIEKKENVAKMKAKKEHILKLIEDKQDEAMSEKSIEELTKELEELE